MVNKPLIRPYFVGGVALAGVARIRLISGSVTASVYKGKSITCLQGGPRADRYIWGES